MDLYLGKNALSMVKIVENIAGLKNKLKKAQENPGVYSEKRVAVWEKELIKAERALEKKYYMI